MTQLVREPEFRGHHPHTKLCVVSSPSRARNKGSLAPAVLVPGSVRDPASQTKVESDRLGTEHPPLRFLGSPHTHLHMHVLSLSLSLSFGHMHSHYTLTHTLTTETHFLTHTHTHSQYIHIHPSFHPAYKINIIIKI